jgi:hypothetical protein
MKTLLLFSLFFCASHAIVHAQPPIEPTRRYEGTVEYQKTKQPATIMEFRYPEKELEEVLEKYIEKQGGTIKKQKGFNYVKSVRIHERENRYYDLYYKVEGSGKGDNARSTIYFILAEPGENILLRDPSGNSGNAAAASVGAVTFFGAMGSAVGAYDHETKIKEQEELVAKAQKRKADLEKKRDQLVKELDETNQDITRQAAEIDKVKTILEQLKNVKKN